MIALNNSEIQNVSGAGLAGVIVYGTIGFWTGAFLGSSLCGITSGPAGVLVGWVPGAVVGTLYGMYSGLDDGATETIYVIKEPLNPQLKTVELA